MAEEESDTNTKIDTRVYFIDFLRVELNAVCLMMFDKQLRKVGP